MYSCTDPNLISSLCQVYENKDRYIAIRCLQELFKGYEINMTQTPLTCPVDLTGTIGTKERFGKYNIEVKERNLSPSMLLKYPDSVLKVEKYQRMSAVTPSDTFCLYMVLLNESTCYVYNLSVMDWSKVTTFNWKIKQTQVDPNSSYKYYPTYKIPTELAVATVDITKIVAEWKERSSKIS